MLAVLVAVDPGSGACRSHHQVGSGRPAGWGCKVRFWPGWLAYSLGQEQLPEPWVQSGLVTAVGSQTARSIYDIAAITAADGHVPVQSKKGLGLETGKNSPLGNAVRQVVEQHLQGVPDGGSGAFRPG